MKVHPGMYKLIAIITVCSLITAAPQQTITLPPNTAAAPAAAPPPPVDGGWPRSYATPSGGGVVLYQPQIASWDNQVSMTLYSAVAYTPKGGKRALGTIKGVSNTKVSVSERLVEYSDTKITEANFPTLDKGQVQEIATAITEAMKPGIIALDRVLAGVDKSQIIPKNIEGIKADPPQIFFSKTPAILVNVDGPPIWSPIMGNDLQYAINTNWDLFLHAPTNIYYLRYNESWLRTSTLEGGWVPAKLPDSFKKLPMDDNWKEVKAAVPGKKMSAKEAPHVFYTTTPAEMILLKGEPAQTPVTNTGLFWISNTESDVFQLGKTGAVYYLVAGRWFSAPDFTGPWTFATPNLPEDFKKIALEHPRSRVLASVPGTSPAAEAVLLAQVPETARVSKKTVKAPEVNYQGEPQFETIKPTTLERAVNTDKQIIKLGDLYYMCFQAVWFVSRSPEGPWEVTGDVPKEIYSIPTDSPVHNVTYVTVVEEDDNDDAVVFAAAAAYTGMMVAWGCAVWGTGYYYPPYVWYGGGYPIYYPHYPTYGYSAWYNPYSGAYGRGAAVYGPYGGAGVTARYNPRTGTYSRGAAAYGPYGSRAYGEAYNPRTGAYGSTRQGSNIYGSWGSTGVQRGDQWATTSRVTNNVTGTTTRVTQTDQGGAISRRGPDGGGFVGTSQGDVYAGRDGNVYRNQDGSWQQYNNGSWNNVQATPEQKQQAQQRATEAQNRANQARSTSSGLDSTTASQLNQDRSVRSEGTQRTKDMGAARSSPSYGSSRMGSYRGGGFGGRRR